MVRIWKKKDEREDEDKERERQREGEWPRRAEYYPRRWMDPFWDDDFFGRGLFRELEEEMERMHREMDALMERALRGDLPPPEKGGPIVYGFSMHVGPDGKPNIQEFGNTNLAKRPWNLPFRRAPGLGSGGGDEDRGTIYAREPITDIIETKDEVWITAELPGVDKKDINLEIDEDSLTISVDSEDRKYYKEVNLPAAVDDTKVKATYNNGVLDVKLKKQRPKKTGKRIKVE